MENHQPSQSVRKDLFRGKREGNGGQREATEEDSLGMETKAHINTNEYERLDTRDMESNQNLDLPISIKKREVDLVAQKLEVFEL